MKKSTIFWNSLYILFMIIMAFINLEVFVIVMVLNGALTFIMFMDGGLEDSHFSIMINPLSLFILVIAGIIVAGTWIGKNTIVKFNKWLDNEEV